MTARAQPGPWARARGVWRQHRDLLRNAASLGATTGLAAACGFFYWIVAAKKFSQVAVGYGSEAVSVMTLLGTIGMFGLGTMLIGELPKRKARGGLFSAALIASALGSLVLGLGFPLVAELFGAHYPQIVGSPARLVLFAVGVALTGATLVFDEGTIGLMRGGVQLGRNVAMSVAKLLLLPVTAVVLHDALGVGLVFAWVLGTIVSLAPVAVTLAKSGSGIFHRPDWKLLRQLAKVAMTHNWLNLAITTPPKLIPVLVALVVTPSANAAFYVAYMIASFLFLVPTHLSTVLFAIASAAPEVIQEKLRFVIRLSLMIGLPAMAVLALGAHFALGVFGPGYATLATLPLWLLILSYIPGLPKAQYIAVCRASGRVGRAAVVLSICACCEFAAVIVGGKVGGLDGLSFAGLCVSVLEGAVTAPTVFRAAYSRSAAAASATAAARPAYRTAAVRLPRTGTGYEIRQEAGLTALGSLASAVVSQMQTLDIATEVWRTGSFPAMRSGDDSSRHAHRSTVTDLFPSAGLDGDNDLPGRSSYLQRQLAGLDALLSMATREPAGGYSHEDPSGG